MCVCYKIQSQMKSKQMENVCVWCVCVCAWCEYVCVWCVWCVCACVCVIYTHIDIANTSTHNDTTFTTAYMLS